LAVTAGGSGGATHLDISARLEADSDSDGFGDKTQDQCPTDATTQQPLGARERRLKHRIGLS
jgi:hypothetical protein